MKRFTVLLLFLFLCGLLLAQPIDGIYPVKAKWSVSVFSGTINPPTEKPYEISISSQPDGSLKLLIPALTMSPDYPASPEVPLEGLVVSYDKKGNASLSYTLTDEQKEMGIESISGSIKKGALEFKIKMHVKGFPFDINFKFESI